MILLLRKPGHGKASCKAIEEASEGRIKSWRGDKRIPKHDVIVRWGCSVPLRTQAPVINSARAIGRTSNKGAFRLALQEAKVSTPLTWQLGVFAENFEPKFPLIARPPYHQQGKDFLIINRMEDLDIIPWWKYEGGYISQYIPKVAEYRVFCAQGRAFAVTKKQPKDVEAIAWSGVPHVNVKFNDWPLRVVKEAIKALAVSGLHFAAIDVIVDCDGVPYVLEANTAPGLESPYRAGLFAKVLLWMVDRGTDVIPLIEAKGGYTKFIHPAVCNQAK